MSTLIPIGSDYLPPTLQRFAQAAVQRDTNGIVDLLVLPITYASDSQEIPESERTENMTLADERRVQIEDACNAVKQAKQSCRVVLAPVLTHPDALLQSNLDLFVKDLDGMYILGGDQTIAMQVVANTPFEERMAAAFKQGAVVGGNSAGAAVQSRSMINGYVGDFGPENGFQKGIVDLWLYEGPSDATRGLSFGIKNAIFEQHTFQRGRIARLLNASFSSRLLGIGLDAETGAIVTNESMLTDVTGTTAAVVVDLQSYAASGRFAGPTSSLSLHKVATHLIPPGNFGYDLQQRRPLVNGKGLPAPNISKRNFNALRVPSGYGPLLLGGDLSADRAGAVTQRFVTVSGGKKAQLVVLTLGYAKSSDAQAEAKAWATALQGVKSVQWFVLDAKVDQNAVKKAIASASGVLITAPDQSLVLDALNGANSAITALRNGWAQGKAVLADNAVAAALGATLTLDPPSTEDSLETDAMGDFLADGVTVQPGLKWLPGVAIEPRMVLERHWGRLYSQLAHTSTLLGLGVDVNTALEITTTGASVVGSNTVVVLDGRLSSFATGTNGALSALYVMLDSYVQGDTVLP
ncbi:MAG: Type 1 glutamine amidotransferase-like domain-containing protein [Caldilineaceae bacterium]